MTEHRYPAAAMRSAYARTGLGLVLSAGPMLLVETGLTAALVLAVLVVLFAAYGIRSGVRQMTRITVDDRGIAAVGPFSRAIEWRHLTAVKLSYYTTKRDSRGGWLQLDIRGPGRTMRIESTLEGFSEIVARAVEEAQQSGIALSPATRDNLRPLGISLRPATRPGDTP